MTLKGKKKIGSIERFGKEHAGVIAILGIVSAIVLGLPPLIGSLGSLVIYRDRYHEPIHETVGIKAEVEAVVIKAVNGSQIGHGPTGSRTIQTYDSEPGQMQTSQLMHNHAFDSFDPHVIEG